MKAVSALRNQFVGTPSSASAFPGNHLLYVRHLGLARFRSWQTADLELEQGRTVFIGPNGFGKTNLVEALWYSSTLGSHRVATDAPLIRAGADRAVVSTIVVNEGRELAVDLEITAGRTNKARLNRSPVRSAREILGALRTVLFRAGGSGTGPRRPGRAAALPRRFGYGSSAEDRRGAR